MVLKLEWRRDLRVSTDLTPQETAKALELLAAYENTGLLPGEISDLICQSAQLGQVRHQLELSFLTTLALCDVAEQAASGKDVGERTARELRETCARVREIVKRDRSRFPGA